MNDPLTTKGALSGLENRIPNILSPHTFLSPSTEHYQTTWTFGQSFPFRGLIDLSQKPEGMDIIGMFEANIRIDDEEETVSCNPRTAVGGGTEIMELEITHTGDTFSTFVNSGWTEITTIDESDGVVPFRSLTLATSDSDAEAEVTDGIAYMIMGFGDYDSL